MFKKIALLAAVSAAAASAFAFGPSNVDKVVTLQDGSSVYVFQDGKMAMTDQLGRIQSMAEGHAMPAANGQNIQMVGNETARLSAIRAVELGGE